MRFGLNTYFELFFFFCAVVHFVRTVNLSASSADSSLQVRPTSARTAIVRQRRKLTSPVCILLCVRVDVTVNILRQGVPSPHLEKSWIFFIECFSLTLFAVSTWPIERSFEEAEAHLRHTGVDERKG